MFRRQRNYYYYPREGYRRERRSLSILPRRKRRRGLMKLLGEFLSWFFFLVLVSGAVIGGFVRSLTTQPTSVPLPKPARKNASAGAENG